MYLFKASMTNIPYDPILHDLSISPRNMTSAEIVQYWLGDLSLFFIQNNRLKISDMFQFKDVTQWNQTLQIVDIPSLQFTFSGIFGHLLMLEFGYNTTLTIAEPFMGKNILTRYLTLIDIPRFTWC